MKLLLLAFFLMASPILLVVLITFPWLLLIGALVGLFCWLKKVAGDKHRKILESYVKEASSPFM